MALPSFGQATGYFRYLRPTVRLRRALAEQRESNSRLIDELRTTHELLDQKNAEVMEANHRLKNSIQTAISILKAQADIYADLENHSRIAIALNEASQRLAYIARAHEILYGRGAGKQSVQMDHYLTDICAGLAAAHAQRPVELIVAAEPLELEVRRAVSVALIVVEAVTNAYKHAFANGRHGAIRVELRKKGGDRVFLGVSDNGVGFHPDRHESSVGMRILRNFSRNLGGEAIIDGTAGTRVAVEFPL